MAIINITERTLIHLAHLRNQYRELSTKTDCLDVALRLLEREYHAACRLAAYQGVLTNALYYHFYDCLYGNTFPQVVLDLYAENNVNPNDTKCEL